MPDAVSGTCPKRRELAWKLPAKAARSGIRAEGSAGALLLDAAIFDAVRSHECSLMLKAGRSLQEGGAATTGHRKVQRQ